jgi:hypothetical protein
MNVCLGKKLGVVEDPRTFHLRALLDPVALPKPPVSWRFATALRNVPMFANDRYGCCTCASHGHRIVAQEYSTQQHEVALKDNDVLEAYSAVTGFNPLDRRTDNGAYMLDVANYMRRTGMGREKDGSRHTVEAFVKVNHVAQGEVKTACNLFGGVWVGVWLPVSAQVQTGPGLMWDRPEGQSLTGVYEPGSWGGHAVHAIGYNKMGVQIYTWGQEQFLTWRFWAAYVDEAYAFISEDWFRAGGTTPRGFKVEQLRNWLSELRS